MFTHFNNIRIWFFGTDQYIYLICRKTKFNGFIKVGYKLLFIYDKIGAQIEINPLCILDFYIYASYKRNSMGTLCSMKWFQKKKLSQKNRI